MHLNDKERAVLVGALQDGELLCRTNPDATGLPYGRRLGALRLRVADARDGIVPMNAAAWLGREPTPSDSVMLSRAYARLDALGLLERITSRYGLGGRTVGLRLTGEGEELAKRLSPFWGWSHAGERESSGGFQTVILGK